MSAEPSMSRMIGFWPTVWLLLGLARRRSFGRFQRQQQLLQQRSGSSVNTLSVLSQMAIWGVMTLLNAGAAYILFETIRIVQSLDTPEQYTELGALDIHGPLPSMMATF